MKLSKTKIVLWSIAAVVTAFFVYVLLFFIACTDTKNVTIEGYVIDQKSNKPIKDARIGIQNYRYESDEGHQNFDEYLGTDIVILSSDEKGFYHTTFNKSAYVVVSVMKDGYQSKDEPGEYSQKNMKFKTFLKRK